MRIRARYGLDIVFVAMFVAFAIMSWIKAADPNLYSKKCSGRSGWLCELAKNAAGYEVIGLNPVFLLFGLLMLSFVSLSVRRIWTGSAALLVGDNIWVPQFYSTVRVAIADIDRAEIMDKAFGLVSILKIHRKDGTFVVIGNAYRSDLEALSQKLQLNQPASPATPPAT